MRIRLWKILLVAAPFMVVGAEPDPPAIDAVPPKGTGPLSPMEARFQGTWKPGYTIVIEGRDFCADTQPGEWYEGYIVIRTDEEPAQIDFVIEDCACDFRGAASAGIFRREGEAIVVASAVPDNARPQDFKRNEQEVVMRFEGDGRSHPPGEHCSRWVRPAEAK